MPRKRTDITVPDLSGRRAVLTGGSDGIGLVIARRLAVAGADLVLPVRNRDKGEAALDRDPRRCAGRHRHPADPGPRVAGVGRRLRGDAARRGPPDRRPHQQRRRDDPARRRSTVDGHELQLGTNHLGHVALVAHLLPLLRAGRARVTSQVSIAANRNAINWDDPDWRALLRPLPRLQPLEDRARALRARARPPQQRTGLGDHQQPLPPGRGADQPARLPAGDRPGRRDTRDPCDPAAVGPRHRRDGRDRGPPRPPRGHLAGGRGGRFYGPRGLGHLSGAPAEQKLYRRLRSPEDAERIWQLSEELAGVSFPVGNPTRLSG